ncbi:MAG: protease inhibitor I42 family protein [Siphonobacter sp.]
MKTLQLLIGQKTKIDLTGTNTAGYEWICVATPAHKVDIQKTYENNGAVGGASSEVFVIKALHTGAVQLEFRQKRPWENNRPDDLIEKIELQIIE